MQDTITNSIDIWTAAQTTKTNARGNKKADYQTLHGVNKLRELILELAVMGKLVPQNPKDEPASVLLKKIADEKTRLIKEGKIKPQKPLTKIEEAEYPIELPKGWEWEKLGNFVYLEMGQSPPSKFYNQEQSGIPFFQGKADFGDLYPTPRYWCIQPTKYSYPGDVLLSVRAPVGPTNISNTECCIGRGLCALRPLAGSNTKYILYFMRAFQRKMEALATGTTFGAVSKTVVESFLVTIPPLSEQQRIVTKVDELMSLCDQLAKQNTDSNATHKKMVETLLGTLTNALDQTELETAWQRIDNHFDTVFTTEHSIDQFKQTILQLAVMGKLVPQNPDGESASVLLEKIGVEKERLIKEGKLKKQKPLPEISEDEKPFELPQGWAWARFPEVGEFGRGKSKHRPRNDPSLYSGGKYPMVQTGDVARANGEVETYTALYNDKGLSQSRLWHKGTMCITIAANIADSGILGFDACFPDSIVGFIPFAKIGESRYFEYFMRTAKEHLTNFAPSTAQKNINLGILETVYIPLPPAEEIKRIVAKVDELFSICEALKVRINSAQSTQIQLTDAIVEQAVA